jgi:hypothetical protein
VHKERIAQREATGDPILTAAAVFHLACFYKANERYGDAEEQFKKMVSLAEKVRPPTTSAAGGLSSPRGGTAASSRGQVHVATALLHLVDFYFFCGRYLAPCSFAATIIFFCSSLSRGLTTIHSHDHVPSRFNDAEPVLQRAMDIRQKNLGSAPLDYALCLEKVWTHF